MTSRPLTLYVLIALFIALLPALLLRDLNPVNEFNYLAIAHDALERGTLFAFYQDGIPYADKPPLYLWIAMLSYMLGGLNPFILLCVGATLPLLGLFYVMDRFLGRGYSARERALMLLALASLLFLSAQGVMGRMDILFTFFIALAWLMTKERVREVLRDGISFRYRLTLPLCIFAGLFTKGPYAVIFILLALFFLLLFKGALRQYFRVFKPSFFLVLLTLTVLWALCVLADGGMDYARELFVGQSEKRLAGSTGHPRPVYWYLTNLWYIAAPVAFAGLLFTVMDVKARLSTLSVERLGCLAFCAAVFITVSLPSSKLEIYLTPALPFAAYYVLLSLLEFKQESAGRLTRHLLRLSFILPLLPFAALLPAYFILRHSIPLLNSTPLLALPFALISLAALYALWLVVKERHLTALAWLGGGMLSFFLSLGFCLPALNPYLGYHDLAQAVSKALDDGYGPTLCTLKMRAPQNFFLYDARFKVVEDPENWQEDCQGAVILASRKSMQRSPELRDELLQAGGVMIGDNLILTLPRN